MKTEFEVKVLDIDVEKIKGKLEAVGAESKGVKNYRRNVYDVNDDKRNWVRLRCDGNRVTITYKEIESFEIDGTKEASVEVNDFDAAHELLMKTGLLHKAYQENRRTSFRLGNVKIEIDEWPLIPAYLEIEGESAEEVYQVMEKLGISKEDATSIDNLSVYKKYGIELHEHKELRFD